MERNSGSAKPRLGPVWRKLIADGDIDGDVVPGVIQRSDHASWLNPVIHADTYYIHALAVKPEFRGKRIGYQLIDGAIKRAKEGLQTVSAGCSLR